LEKEQRKLLGQQQEIKRKMTALLSAASTGKLMATETPADQPIRVPPVPPNESETTAEVRGPLTNSQLHNKPFINACH